MRETPLGCKILELNDAANIPLESANNEILEAAIEKKVDKVEGKGLSTNDYTTTEKNKLAGIDSGANKYVHPATHPATIIVEDANNRFVTDVEKSNWNSAAEKGIPYASASGTNTYTASVAGLSSLTEGLSIKIKFLNANTGASTLNINSLGAKTIKKSNGSELSSGNIKAGQICHLVYTGSNFQLLGEGGEYGTAQAGDVLAGKTIGTEAGLIEGTIPIKSAETITPGTSNKIIDAGQYLSGNQTILGDPSLVSSNIKANASIFNVQGDSNVVNTADSNATAAQIRSGYTAYVKGSKLTGTMPNKTSETYTPGTANQIINSGQYLSGNQTILGDNDLVSSNIKSGVNIFGVVGDSNVVDTSDATAVAANIRSGYTAYVKGTKLVGIIPSKSAETITPGTSNKIIAAGQYLSGQQTILGDSDLTPENIKIGVGIFGVPGTLIPANSDVRGTGTLSVHHEEERTKAFNRLGYQGFTGSVNPGYADYVIINLSDRGRPPSYVYFSNIVQEGDVECAGKIEYIIATPYIVVMCGQYECTQNSAYAYGSGCDFEWTSTRLVIPVGRWMPDTMYGYIVY